MMEKPTSIWAALAAAQSNFEPVKATGSNPHFRSTYATLGDIHKATRKALLAAGLVVTSAPVETETGHAVECTIVYAETGETITQLCPLILGKQDMQGLGSAISYARRYLLLSMLDLDMDGWDDDGEASVAQPTVKTQTKRQTPKQSTPFDDAPNTVTDDNLHELDELGIKQYADGWQEKRTEIVYAKTAKRTGSAAELTNKEAIELINALRKRTGDA